MIQSRARRTAWLRSITLEFSFSADNTRCSLWLGDLVCISAGRCRGRRIRLPIPDAIGVRTAISALRLVVVWSRSVGGVRSILSGYIVDGWSA